MALIRSDDALLRRTAWLMLGTDIGFLLYWTLVTVHALPPEQMFHDYDQPSVAAWNWSFLPLDLLASVTGFLALRALRRGRPIGLALLPLSLTLTSTAGGMALAYWAVAGDVELSWWLPNAFLLVFPIPAMTRLARTRAFADRPGSVPGLGSEESRG
ncbi:hypothetical protein GCM10009839_17930 [Catenulispora yoronensis]|uniref:DUF2637 domain-containing protein n=1 Tax=Catenulispora yoronensis TaxID=450799 RepID=A0ABN2TU05_9ACTN